MEENKPEMIGEEAPCGKTIAREKSRLSTAVKNHISECGACIQILVREYVDNRIAADWEAR